MSAYVSQYRQIRDALVVILSNLQADFGSGNEPVFKLATADNSQEFKQEPFAFVTTIPGEDIKAAVGEQDRCYDYRVLVLLNLENEQRTRSQSDDLMLDLIELTLNALDEADWHDLLNQTDTTLDNWILNANKFDIYVGDSKSGALLLGMIDLEVKYTIDLT